MDVLAILATRTGDGATVGQVLTLVVLWTATIILIVKNETRKAKERDDRRRKHYEN